MSIVRCHVHPQVYAYVTALLADTPYRSVRGACEVVENKSAPLLLSAYQSPAHGRDSYPGIRQLVEWRRGEERAPALVCAFRSKQHLLRFPANTILQEPGTLFLRLPCSRQALLSKLENARPLSSEELEGVVSRACTSWGQLISSIDRLIEMKVEAGDTIPDLKPLHDFARQYFGHFSSQFRKKLARAETRWQQGDTDATVRLLRQLQERVPEATVYQVFGTLAHGRSADLSNKGVGPLRAALLSMQQGLVGEEHLETVLATESWSDFKSALQDATRTLTLLRNSPKSLPGGLQEQVNTFLERVDGLLSMIQTGRIQTEPATAVEAIDDLQDASRSILRRRPDDAD